MRNQIKTILLLATLGGALVVFGGALGRGYLYLATGVALALNVGAYFFSDRIVLRMNRAREVPPGAAPELEATVGELARRAGIPRPRLYLIDDPQPNAFATGRNPAHGVVAVTTGILERLDRRELRAVLAHEIAHIGNRDILIGAVAAVLATAISHLATAAQFGMLFGGGQRDDERSSPLATLLLVLVAPLAATLIHLGISRSREYQADARGARLCGDPEALASALLRLEHAAGRIPGTAEPATASLYIVNPLRAGARAGASFARLFSTHPPAAERVARLRALAADPGFGRAA